jgi:hypothetical protein
VRIKVNNKEKLIQNRRGIQKNVGKVQRCLNATPDCNAAVLGSIPGIGAITEYEIKSVDIRRSFLRKKQLLQNMFLL